MAFLSVTEAVKRFNIPESNIRYWISTNKLQHQIEVRNGRNVTVIDDEELLNLVEPATEAQSDGQPNDSTGQAPLPPAVKMYEEKIAQRDSEIQRLQFELGRATGELQQLKERLQEKADEVAEWKREVAAAREKPNRPWWKFWQ